MAVKDINGDAKLDIITAIGVHLQFLYCLVYGDGTFATNQDHGAGAILVGFL